MSRGKYQSKRKPFPILSVALIVLLLVALTSGGAVAYLAKSASPVTNTFQTAPNPTVTVNSDNSVTVTVNSDNGVSAEEIGYSVYLRAAVVPNWKYSDRIVAASPDSFTITPGENWFLHTDGFYYYKLPVQSNSTTASPIYTEVEGGTNPGGTLEVDVAVQAIQALGKTDSGDVTAVMDAWKVQPENPNTTP